MSGHSVWPWVLVIIAVAVVVARVRQLRARRAFVRRWDADMAELARRWPITDDERKKR